MRTLRHTPAQLLLHVKIDALDMPTPSHVASRPHKTAMEKLKDDFREDRSLLQIATVRHLHEPRNRVLLQRFLHTSHTHAHQYVGRHPSPPPHSDVASPTANLSPHGPPLHHLDHPLRLRSRRVLVLLLQLHTRARHLRTRIPAIRPRSDNTLRERAIKWRTDW